ncbi:hypothetical protein EO216_22700 [Flammeovirga kamogawensis]|nr:hypothetical protein [Flammeovirga kamogawensis]TRX65336.1 hypothetical protein EO216_22700 [Flammeovirga kamogawensis]
MKGQDDGGHLIANVLYGPGEQINYLPQRADLNRGKWKAMENDWRKFLEEDPNNNLKVWITPIYEGDSQRPIRFEARHEVYDLNGKFIDEDEY